MSENANPAPAVDATALQELIEQEAIVLSATFLVQCLGCGQAQTYTITNENPTDPGELPSDEFKCPTCTQREGKPCVIPVLAAAGGAVNLLEEQWEKSSEASK